MPWLTLMPTDGEEVEEDAMEEDHMDKDVEEYFALPMDHLEECLAQQV